LDWRSKAELFEEIRREYEFGSEALAPGRTHRHGRQSSEFRVTVVLKKIFKCLSGLRRPIPLMKVAGLPA
jgi:hypothetical protein